MRKNFRLKLGLGMLATCTAVAAGLIAPRALAQTCDDRFPSMCRNDRSQEFPRSLVPLDSVRPGMIMPAPERVPRGGPMQPRPRVDYGGGGHYAAVAGEPYPIPAVTLSNINPEFLRKSVLLPTSESAGTIIVDAHNHFLYFVQGGGRAIRYGVGVGRQGFGWSGIATIHDKQAWPDWYPPKEMIARQPDLRRHVTELQSGLGVPGGPGNPLGARAMYLWQGNKDTLYRIHGTVEPWTIGTSVSSGCIRMINQDAIDLYERVTPGAKVVVLPARS